MPSRRFSRRKIVEIPDQAFGIRELGDHGVYAFTDYVRSLQTRHVDKITSYLRRLAEHGPEGFGRKDQFENLGGGVYELKPKPHRLLLGRVENQWMILDAFSKDGLRKRAQTKKIDDARDLMLEFSREIRGRR